MPLHNQNTDFLDRSNTYPKYRFYSKIGTLHHFGWGWVVGYREMPSPLLTHIHTHNVKKNGVNDTVCLVVHKKSYMQKCTSIKKMHGCIIIRVIELFFDLFCIFCTYDFFTAIPVVQKQYQTFVTLRFPFFRLFLLICRRWS